MAKNPTTKSTKTVETLKHDEATRKNIPTAEFQSVLDDAQKNPRQVRYPRPDASELAEEKSARNRDLDPQLVWRGKDEQDWSDLVVHAPPLYIQEKVHPKALIDDLLRQTKESQFDAGQTTADLFADFNGIPKGADKTEFYAHDQNWSNRMILGDSLQVMASLAEREGLRGKVQCIYFDPPYGIKFNSNFQWSTTSRDVKDGNAGHITREPEQVKAFRDTWRDGIHSYLTYLRDRLTVARDLLTDSGSIFVQISDENEHRVRALLDEVFGDDNFVALVTFKKTGGQTSTLLAPVSDYILWFAKDRRQAKFRQQFREVRAGEGHSTGERYDQVLMVNGAVVTAASVADNLPEGSRHFRYITLSSNRPAKEHEKTEFSFRGRSFLPPANRTWTTTHEGLSRIAFAGRMHGGDRSLNYAKFIDDFPAYPIGNLWDDVSGSGERWYVVQTSQRVVQRCMLLSTDPGDLVLDPTCGSGTTATVAEQWGRRWITIDTSRVALALARARVMGARYPYYVLADSREGQLKEAEVTRTAPS
ncbi:site-specific DNA-methyltransferase, partial [bacterium]|nr:site-specific DNA-methyltransferase [bacterium]